jgi:hypothetical protein
MDERLKKPKGFPAGAIRPGNAAAVWQAKCLHDMAMSMGGWLQSNDDMNKPVHRLSLRELEGMAWAAMATYAKLREIERKRHDVSLLDESALDDLEFVIRGD